MATNPAVRVPEAEVESSASAVHWGAITAGAIGAVGISFILISLGGALGRAAVSPWSPSGAAPTAFGRVAAIWLIVTNGWHQVWGATLPVACARSGSAFEPMR
jgi:hypothetical protein